MKTRTNGKKSGSSRGRIRAALPVALAFLLGWGASLVGSAVSDPPVRIDGYLTGTVSQIDATGSAFCLIPDGRTQGEQRCSSPFQRPGSARLQIGQHISVAVERLRIDRDRMQEAFIVYDPPPAP